MIVMMCFFREEVLSYTTHSPVKTDKALEDVLGNLNLNSTITPQMAKLGLSQQRKSSANADMKQTPIFAHSTCVCVCVSVHL